MNLFDKETDRRIGMYGFTFLIIAFIAVVFIDSKWTASKYEGCIDIASKKEVCFVVVGFEKVKGGCYASTDSVCYMIESSANYSYKYEYIQDNVFPGDSTLKHLDTIYVFSQTRGELYFVLGKNIND